MKNYTWVTGASNGIGRELVRSLVQKGTAVLATARNAERLDALRSELASYGDLLEIAVCDVAETKQIDIVIDTFLADGSRNINALINNAGVTSFKNATDDSWETILAIIQTNVTGAVYCIRKVLPGMIQQSEGAIVNILSVVCKKTFTKSSIYSASKAALEAYANVLREEVRKKNIHVMNVYPGATITGIWPESVVQAQGGKMMQAKDVAEIVSKILVEKQTAYTEELVLRPVTGDL